MLTASVRFRKVGGSLVVSVPKEMARELSLRENQTASASLEDGKLILEPGKRVKPRYRIEDLVAQCDLNAPMSDEDKAWIDMPSVGREIIE